MIYKENVRIPSSEKVVEHYVANCVKCNSDDIYIQQYEDTFGYISTATCKKCKSEVKVQSRIKDVILKWNKLNDIPLLIENKKLLILQTKEEIKELIKLQKIRK